MISISRKNIFETVSGTFNLEHELQRIKRLFEKEYPVYVFNDGINYSVRGYVAKHGFYQWRNRGRSVDVDDFLSMLEYDKLWVCAVNNIQDFFIELRWNGEPSDSGHQIQGIELQNS